MGPNLNKLMKSYGVYTPTVSAYSGVATPDALKAGATAGEKGTYQGALADYAAQQAAFKGYETDYKNRIANTNLYTSPDTASTFLSTPNYSGIRGMRANLSDTTSEDTTDYTNPNFSSMINDAYRSLGRVGIGTDTSNIDQPGYNYWLGQLQAGANGGIAPRDFKNQFKIATNDYIRQKPDDDYTKYIQGYLGILPAATLPVLPTTGGVTTSGTDVDQRAGEGPGANPGSAYDGGGMGLGPTGNEQVGLDANQAANNQNASASATAEIADQQNAQDAADAVASSGLMARGGPVSSPTSMEEALLRDRSRHEFSDPRFEEIYNKYFYGDRGGVANPIDGEIARRRRQAFPGIPPMYTGAPRVLNNNPAELPQITGIDDDSERQGPPGPVSSPTSTEQALLRDRSRHEFSDPRFEEIYGKYFYDTGGTFIPAPRSALQKVLKYEGLLPGFFGRGPDIASPGDTPPPSLPPSFIPDPLSVLQNALKYKGLLPEFFGRGPNIASPSDSSAAERGGSLGSFGDVPSSVGNPDDLMSLVYNPGNMPRVTGGGENDRARRRTFLGVTPMYTGAPRVLITGIDDDSERQGPPGPVPLSAVTAPTPETGSQGRADKSDRDPITTDAPLAVTPTPVTGPDTLFSGDSSQTVDAIKRAREAQDAYRKGLGDQSSDETGPSEAEKYFRLAAAFLAPTKTGQGAFGESVANAARSEVERLREETLRKTAEKNKRNDMRLKERELDYKLTHDEVIAMREMDKQRRQADLMIFLEKMKRDAKSEEISPADLKTRDGLEISVNRTDEAIRDLEKALELNPNTYKGTWADQFGMRVQEEAGLAGQIAKNTRIQSNLLFGQSVNSLKEIFGGNPSNAEREALSGLVGLDAKTLEVREEIINKLLLAAINRRNVFNSQINSINSPRTRRRSTSDE